MWCSQSRAFTHLEDLPVLHSCDVELLCKGNAELGGKFLLRKPPLTMLLPGNDEARHGLSRLNVARLSPISLVVRRMSGVRRSLSQSKADEFGLTRHRSR